MHTLLLHTMYVNGDWDNNAHFRLLLQKCLPVHFKLGRYVPLVSLYKVCANLHSLENIFFCSGDFFVIRAYNLILHRCHRSYIVINLNSDLSKTIWQIDFFNFVGMWPEWVSLRLVQIVMLICINNFIFFTSSQKQLAGASLSRMAYALGESPIFPGSYCSDFLIFVNLFGDFWNIFRKSFLKLHTQLLLNCLGTLLGTSKLYFFIRWPFQVAQRYWGNIVIQEDGDSPVLSWTGVPFTLDMKSRSPTYSESSSRNDDHP